MEGAKIEMRKQLIMDRAEWDALWQLQEQRALSYADLHRCFAVLRHSTAVQVLAGVKEGSSDILQVLQDSASVVEATCQHAMNQFQEISTAIRQLIDVIESPLIKSQIVKLQELEKMKLKLVRV